MLVRVFPLLTLLAMLLGCSLPAGSLSGKLPPSVTIADVRPGQIGLLEQSLILTLRFVNPNPEDIGVDGMRLNLDLADRRLDTGVSNEVFTLPRLGEATVPVTIRVQTADLIEQVMQLGTAETVDYRIEGRLFGSGTFGTGLDFDATSSIRLPQLTRPVG